MTTLAEIEQAIENLPERDVKALGSWFDQFRERKWDERMEADAREGKLNLLVEEARQGRKEGTLRRFP